MTVVHFPKHWSNIALLKKEARLDNPYGLRQVIMAVVFGGDSWALADTVSPAVAIGVAPACMAAYVAGVEARVNRLERASK